jgi:hypothetical protein
MTSAEQRRYGEAAVEARQLARDIADWAHGITLWSKHRKRDLIDTIEFTLENSMPELAAHFERQLAALRMGLAIRQMSPTILAGAYANVIRTNRGAVEKFIRIGRADREDAELVTSTVVAMIAESAMRKAGSTSK